MQTLVSESHMKYVIHGNEQRNISSRTSLTPRYVFTPQTLAAPPATTTAVAMLNALKEYKTSLKLSSVDVGKGSSEGLRNRVPAFADGAATVDIGSVRTDAVRGGGGTAEGRSGGGARLTGGAKAG
jgi:hypothetical protein